MKDQDTITIDRLFHHTMVFLACSGWIIVAFLLGILLGEGPRR